MTPIVRVAIASLSLSAFGLVAIATSEGFTDTAVIPIPGDVPTKGFGTTRNADGTPVKLGDKTTPVKALQDKIRDVQKFEGAVKQCVKVPLHQYEYDAYISLSYNVGSTRFCNSSIPDKLNAGQYEAACKTILDFNKFRDCSKPKVLNPKTGKLECPLVPVRGLTVRREGEYKQCTGG